MLCASTDLASVVLRELFIGPTPGSVRRICRSSALRTRLDLYLDGALEDTRLLEATMTTFFHALSPLKLPGQTGQEDAPALNSFLLG